MTYILLNLDIIIFNNKYSYKLNFNNFQNFSKLKGLSNIKPTVFNFGQYIY